MTSDSGSRPQGRDGTARGAAASPERQDMTTTTTEGVTPAMMSAGIRAVEHDYATGYIHDDDIRAIYLAMHSTRPTAPGIEVREMVAHARKLRKTYNDELPFGVGNTIDALCGLIERLAGIEGEATPAASEPSRSASGSA